MHRYYFMYWLFIFLFQLTILTESNQYLLWSEAYYLLTWSLLHLSLCFDSIIFHFEEIFYTLIQERQNMTLSYTNIFFYEMRKQKVWFRAVWIYNLIFFHHSLDSPKTSFQPVTTSQLHSPNVNQSCCCYYSGNLITSWAPKPSKVPLA